MLASPAGSPVDGKLPSLKISERLGWDIEKPGNLVLAGDVIIPQPQRFFGSSGEVLIRDLSDCGAFEPAFHQPD